MNICWFCNKILDSDIESELLRYLPVENIVNISKPNLNLSDVFQNWLSPAAIYLVTNPLNSV